MPIEKPNDSSEEKSVINNRSALALVLLLSSCSPSIQKQAPATPDSNFQINPQSLQIAIEDPPPLVTPEPLTMDAEQLTLPESELPEKYKEFGEWVSTKLSSEEGALRGIITAKYKGRNLRLGLVYYGKRAWQYVYDPIVINNDLKKIFGFNIRGPKEYLRKPPVDLYPTFEVPNNEDGKFVHVVHRHMQMSGLLKKLQIAWESERGAILKKAKSE